MKTLVIGSTGNLGSALKRIFPADENVRFYDRSNWRNNEPFPPETQLIIHAASDIHALPGSQPLAFVEGNLHLTARILDKCLLLKQLESIAFISSSAVYDGSQNTEEGIAAPTKSLSGQIKFLSENLIAQFCQKNSLSHHFYRVFNMYGGDDSYSIVSKIVHSALHQKPFELLNQGTATRDFVHVEDVASIIFKTLQEKERESFTTNIGTGKAVSIGELVQRVSHVRKDFQVKNISAPPLPNSVADTSFLKSLIGDYKFRSVLEDIENLVGTNPTLSSSLT